MFPQEKVNILAEIGFDSFLFQDELYALDCMQKFRYASKTSKGE
jgi:hypothetical protein